MSKNYVNFLSLAITSSLLLSGCTNGKAENTEPQKETLPEVEIMEVSFNGEQKISINGEVSASQSATLTAEFKADVRSVFVKPGDSVKKGEILILLDSNSVQQSFDTAQQSLNNTQQTLSQTYSSASKTIESAKISLETAQTTYNNLLTQNTISRKQAQDALDSVKLNLDLSTTSAETSLETAEKSLEKIRELNASSEQSAKDNLENSINSVSSNIVIAINASDQILGVSEVYDDSASIWEGNLGALQKETKNNAETALSKLINSFDNYTESYDSAKSIMQEADDSLDKTLQMLKQSTTGSNFSQTTLNTSINTITAQIASTQQLLTSLISTKNALDQTLAGNASSLTSAEQGVESAKNNLNLTLQNSNGKSQNIINAEAQYEATIAQLNSAEDTAIQQVESAQAFYESAKKGADLSRTSANSGLTGAQGSFEQAKINQEKLLIKAPFDGKVIDVPVKVGDEINMGGILAQIENDDVLKIITYLTPSQAKKINIGDTVKIASQSEDIISAISSSVDPIIKKNKVEILHKNPYLHSGQTVPLVFTVNLNFADENGVIFVPLVAVHVTSSENYVWTIDKNMKTVKTEVETGEINGNQIAVISGLKEGDKIIIKGGRLFKKEEVEVKVIDE